MSEKITADLAKWSMSEISKDALNSIRFRCEARMPFQASEVLPLIAEVERLREKCDDLTVNGFRVNLKQLDEAKKEIERLQAEVKRLNEVVAGYFGSGQRIQDLSDDCGLLEESNKALRAEVARLCRERGLAAKLFDVAHAEVERLTTLKPIDTLHDDDGTVLLWRFDSKGRCDGPPDVGSILDAGFDKSDYTHWSPIPNPKHGLPVPPKDTGEGWAKIRREFDAKEGGA